MTRLITLILGLILTGQNRINALMTGGRKRDDRGSVTIENVLWAVAVIAIVAIVVAAIRAYVTSESGKLR